MCTYIFILSSIYHNLLCFPSDSYLAAWWMELWTAEGYTVLYLGTLRKVLLNLLRITMQTVKATAEFSWIPTFLLSVFYMCSWKISKPFSIISWKVKNINILFEIKLHLYLILQEISSVKQPEVVKYPVFYLESTRSGDTYWSKTNQLLATI